MKAGIVAVLIFMSALQTAGVLFMLWRFQKKVTEKLQEKENLTLQLTSVLNTTAQANLEQIKHNEKRQKLDLKILNILDQLQEHVRAGRQN